MNKLDSRVKLTDAALKERFRQTDAVRHRSPDEDFFDISHKAIREVFGKIEKTDFDSNSAMAGFFAHKQNILKKLLAEENGKGS
jgi:hypothetical protein